MKCNIHIENILDNKNAEAAIDYLCSKLSNVKSDTSKESLGEYWKNNSGRIFDSIYNEKYAISPIQQYEIVSKKSKKRVISVMDLPDKLVARMILQVLAPIFESYFSDACYAYRKTKGTLDVVNGAVFCIEHGNVWVTETDISGFFDNIIHEKLIAQLEYLIEDRKVLALIKAYICCPITDGEKVFMYAKGLLQGSPLSPLLSNIYLSEFDKYMEEKYEHYFRYGDDVRVYTKTKEEGAEILENISSKLTELGLAVNMTKSGTFQTVNRPHFGYELIEKNGHILIQRIQRSKKEVYSEWRSSTLKEIDHHYHIINDGIITKKDFTLLFENEDEKKYLPIERIESLNIYSNVVFSSGFFDFANSEDLLVNIIDRFGNTVGRFVPQTSRKNIKAEIAQIALLSNPSEHIALAKVFQKANIFNLRASLRYYERRGADTLIRDTVDELTCIYNKIDLVESINSLLIYEAQARQSYFRCFNTIMSDDDFEFVKRSRKPPLDAIDALISFGNTLLYNRFASEILRSALDIRFGILHNSNTRSESLNLDLADLFKPVIVDRTIFTLVNKHMINEVQDFEESNGGVYLTTRGKRIFIKEFDSKLSQTVNVGGIKVSYSELISKEVRKVQKYFLNDEKYKPYRYVN